MVKHGTDKWRKFSGTYCPSFGNDDKNGNSYNDIPYDEAKIIFDDFCQIFNEEM